jgi:hypothetical protein
MAVALPLRPMQASLIHWMVLWENTLHRSIFSLVGFLNAFVVAGT